MLARKWMCNTVRSTISNHFPTFLGAAFTSARDDMVYHQYHHPRAGQLEPCGIFGWATKTHKPPWTLSHAKAVQFLRQTSLFTSTDNQCLQLAENWKKKKKKLTSLFKLHMIKAQQHFEHQMENLKRLGNEQSGLLGHFGVDTYSLCSMVRDVQQDMLQGL